MNSWSFSIISRKNRKVTFEASTVASQNSFNWMKCRKEMDKTPLVYKNNDKAKWWTGRKRSDWLFSGKRNSTDNTNSANFFFDRSLANAKARKSPAKASVVTADSEFAEAFVLLSFARSEAFIPPPEHCRQKIRIFKLHIKRERWTKTTISSNKHRQRSIRTILGQTWIISSTTTLWPPNSCECRAPFYDREVELIQYLQTWVKISFRTIFSERRADSFVRFSELLVDLLLVGSK